MAMVLSRALDAAGFEVTIAATGNDGIAALQDEDYALAVLDLVLPDIDGVTVLARAASVAPAVPIMVLSAVSDVRSKVVCLELGACDYVGKPCQLAELVARVRLRTSGNGVARHARHLRVGRYVLDVQRRVLHDGAGYVPLTTREFLLLQHLMEHVGRTCSRAELLEQVWGYSFDPGTNVVDVCVGRVRQKLRTDSVATVRNVGYCFVGA
jgi:DNA-binding response OmpR family regulator